MGSGVEGKTWGEVIVPPQELQDSPGDLRAQVTPFLLIGTCPQPRRGRNSRQCAEPISEGNIVGVAPQRTTVEIFPTPCHSMNLGFWFLKTFFPEYGDLWSDWSQSRELRLSDTVQPRKRN